ncbi:hypothetical protein GQ53DRAFT_740655 [Thozetella sp. PMI_491]|nr:hypothetical protein GQ53DRAFT_740655 [Thozetella sp. PMI_491]
MSATNNRRLAETCYTCRRRKLKCSSEKPSCRTCINSGRWCSGYATNPSEYQAPRDLTLQSTAQLTDQNYLIASVTPRHAFRQQILSLYFENQLPEESVAASQERNFWLQNMPYLESLTPSLEAAVLAICAGRLGKQKNIDDLQRKSFTFYGSSLNELQKAIDHPTLRYQDQTLASCLALTTYEFMGTPEERTAGYVAHFNGAIKLLRYRGPMAHASGLAHSTFKAIRTHAIFYSLNYRTTSFLAEKQWLDIPWSSIEKDIHEQLLDIMVKMTRILPDVVNLSENHSLEEILDASIRRVRLCWRLDTELTDWLGRLSAEIHGPIFWPGTFENREGPIPANDDLFPVSYRFPSFMVAQTLLLYWISRMVVCYQLGHFYRKLHELALTMKGALPEIIQCTCKAKRKPGIRTCPFHFNPSQLPALGYRSDWSHATARHICQSARYFLMDEMRSAGPGCFLPLLMMVRQYWEHDYLEMDRSQELRWTERTITLVRSRERGDAKPS